MKLEVITTFAAVSLAVSALSAPAFANPPLKSATRGIGNAAQGAVRNAPAVNIKPGRLVPNTNVRTPAPNIVQPNVKTTTPAIGSSSSRAASPNFGPAQPNVAATQPGAAARGAGNRNQPVIYDRSMPGPEHRPLPKLPTDADVDVPPSYSGLATRNQDKLDDLFEVRQRGIEPETLNLNRNVGRAPAGNDAFAAANRNRPPQTGQSAGFPGYKAGPEQPRWTGGNPYGNDGLASAGRNAQPGRGQGLAAPSRNTPVANQRPLNGNDVPLDRFANVRNAALPDRIDVPVPKKTPGQIAKKVGKYAVGGVVVVGAAAGAGYGMTVGIPAFVEWVDSKIKKK